MAFQIRATAFFLSPSLLTSALPGMLFQISTNRLMGQSADSLASAAGESNCGMSGSHSAASVAFGKGEMVFSASIVNVVMFSPLPAMFCGWTIDRSVPGDKQVNSFANVLNLQGSGGANP